MIARRRFVQLCIAVILCILLLPSGNCIAKKRLTADESLQASVKRETAMGKRIAEEIAKHMDFNEDPIYTARVRGIFNRLTPWVSRPLPYNVHIVKEKSPNAFCIPGGNIYVTSGLLNFVRSDDELAFVIAHELAHADGKHVIVQMERNQKLSLAALAVAIASRGAGAAILLSNVAAIAVANAYSRDLEQEADINGATIAEKAGYDLVAGVTVMESLAAEELKQPWIDPGVYLDHPKIADRISYIADIVEKKGVRLNRKHVLKLLIPKIEETQSELILKVDDTEVLRSAKSAENRAYFSKACRDIEGGFQMETPAYDIRVAQGRGIYAGVRPLLVSPIPSGESPENIRQRFLDALHDARKKHPLANYTM